MTEGVTRKRCGFIIDGPAAREGVEVFNKEGKKVGVVSSGTHSPCLKKSIGQAYIETQYSKVGTQLVVNLRGKPMPLVLSKMPFVPTKYYKKQWD